MVDFKKLLTKKESERPDDPVAIYNNLDRESDKGPLRPVQESILAEWFAERRSDRDVILKLHTGQGKTLIGLLILQSKLNELGEPVVYLCANNFLVTQTCQQAKSFGIAFCTADPDLPGEFLDGKSVLITGVHKLFNGLTKFGIGPKSTSVSTIIVDDAHTCIDTIRASFQIHLDRKDTPYDQLLELFSNSLEAQGAGTFADIKNKKPDALLPVPYWDWRDKSSEVVQYLSKYADSNRVKFAWPLIRDVLPECRCVFSGTHLEISPYLAPLREFGTFDNASHRVFMSATVTDDSFLIKGLDLSPGTVRNPLVFKDERWSGEKMILIPSLIDESLDRPTLVKEFAPPKPGRKHGVVTLTRSFRSSGDWKQYGAEIADTDSIHEGIQLLQNGAHDKALVLVNRYDGIDLPDNTCRILIFDSKPFSDSLADRYEESCRAASKITAIRTARTIEQGLGRSVRGERDYCVILLIGTDLVKEIRLTRQREYFSNQTREQIEIGLRLADVAREDLANGHEPIDVVRKLVKQCLDRDSGWKAYYADQMEKVTPDTIGGKVLDLFKKELDAEKRFFANDVEKAVLILQELANDPSLSEQDRAWYLQEMARYQFANIESESDKLQTAAHKLNHYLLKPRTGVTVTKLEAVSHKRVERIIEWVRQFKNFADLALSIEDILGRLAFGVESDRFEQALNSVGTAIGFKCERPDKEWKEGPDNFWALKDGHYLLYECKSEVKETRVSISASEASQMNTSCAWFQKNNSGASSTNIMIIPTHKVSSGAYFTHEVSITRKAELNKLRKRIKAFFNEFASADLDDLSEIKIQTWLNTHNLAVDDLATEYSRTPHFLT